MESPPLKKGDLGGFENLQDEGIYGKRYNAADLFPNNSAKIWGRVVAWRDRGESEGEGEGEGEGKLIFTE